MHRNGIFHRDVKPENLLLLDDEGAHQKGGFGDIGRTSEVDEESHHSLGVRGFLAWLWSACGFILTASLCLVSPEPVPVTISLARSSWLIWGAVVESTPDSLLQRLGTCKIRQLRHLDEQRINKNNRINIHNPASCICLLGLSH